MSVMLSDSENNNLNLSALLADVTLVVTVVPKLYLLQKNKCCSHLDLFQFV